MVDPVLLNEVNNTPETHPATRESMTKLLTALGKRDKFSFFAQPVTEAVVSWSELHVLFVCDNCMAAQPGCCISYSILGPAMTAEKCVNVPVQLCV
jgi:hypothetical protein